MKKFQNYFKIISKLSKLKTIETKIKEIKFESWRVKTVMNDLNTILKIRPHKWMEENGWLYARAKRKIRKHGLK